MKKVISFLLLSVMMLTMIAPGMAECNHSNCGWVVKREATCTITGWEWWTCKDCGKALADRYTPKKDHTRKTVTVRPACASAAGGLEKVVCADCGTELVATHSTPRRAHRWYPTKKLLPNGKYQYTWRCSGGCGKTVVNNGKTPDPYY